jgi:hypothetical protein
MIIIQEIIQEVFKEVAKEIIKGEMFDIIASIKDLSYNEDSNRKSITTFANKVIDKYVSPMWQGLTRKAAEQYIAKTDTILLMADAVENFLQEEEDTVKRYINDLDESISHYISTLKESGEEGINEKIQSLVELQRKIKDKMKEMSLT